MDESPVSQFPAVLHDFEPTVEIVLEPVDSVVVTTLMDNVTDQGWGLLAAIRLPDGSEFPIYQPRHPSPWQPGAEAETGGEPS